jgi:hypothetical protein
MLTLAQAIDRRFEENLEKALLVRLVQAGIPEATAESLAESEVNGFRVLPPGLTHREFWRLLAEAVAKAEEKALEDEAWYKAHMPDA